MDPKSPASKTSASGMPAPKHSPLARGAALFLVVLLLALIAATLIVGVFGGPGQASLLKALIFADVVLPVLIYAYLLFIKQMKRKERKDGQETEQK